MKWAKEVIIVGTSLLGGAMAGMSLAKIGGLADFPYGIGLSAAFAVLGMLIQFATNRSRYKEDEEEYEASASRGKRNTAGRKNMICTRTLKKKCIMSLRQEEKEFRKMCLRNIQRDSRQSLKKK